MLKDTKTYTPVEKCPLKDLFREYKVLLNDWKDNNYISKQEYKPLYNLSANLSRAYALPKIKRTP